MSAYDFDDGAKHFSIWRIDFQVVSCRFLAWGFGYDNDEKRWFRLRIDIQEWWKKLYLVSMDFEFKFRPIFWIDMGWGWRKKGIKPMYQRRMEALEYR